jgi:regulator of replication initiation timing
MQNYMSSAQGAVRNMADQPELQDLQQYVERLEHRIEILGNENSALAVTLNKLMRENMKLKAELKNLEKRVAAMNALSEVRIAPDKDKE